MNMLDALREIVKDPNKWARPVSAKWGIYWKPHGGNWWRWTKWGLFSSDLPSKTALFGKWEVVDSTTVKEGK